jgi:PAS domain S-box-containing protein
MKLFNKSLHDGIFQRISIAWLVLTISLIATLWGWFMVKQASEQQIRSTVFDYRVERIKNAILNRMFVYQQVLEGGVGLFAASVSVERDEWHDYVQNLHLEKNYSGIQGVGFSKRILPQDLANHQAEIRAEGGWFANYSLRPAGEREEYTSIIYLEPMDKRNQQAIGYDMFSEPTRHTAMVRARDTGEAALSGKVKLVQEIDEDVQAGCLLYIPVYQNGQPHDTVAEKRATLVGYVYSPFRMNNLMRGIFGEDHDLQIDFHIYDADNINNLTPDKLIYDEAKTHHTKNDPFNDSPQFTRIDTLVIAGHPWTIQFATLPDFEVATQTYIAHIVLFGGLLVSFLLFGITRSLETAQSLIVERQANARLQTEIRERHQVEQALQQSEERFDLAMHGSNDGLWDWNLVTNEVYFSPRWKAMLGHADHEIPHQLTEWTKRVHPADLEETMSEVMAYLEKKQPFYENTHRVQHKDGHYLWILDRGIAVWNTEGKPVRMVGTHTDLTALKQAEAALKQSEERFIAVLDNLPVFIYLRAPDYSIRFANRLFRERFGEPMQKPCYEAIYHRTAPCEGCAMRRVFNQPSIPQTLESPLIDGRVYEIHSYPFVDRDGSLLALQMGLDITARKEAETALRRSRDELLCYFEQPLVGMLSSNLKKKSLYINQRFCDIVGYSQEEMQILDWGKITHPDDLVIDQAYFDQVLRGEIDSYEMEKRYIHKDGHLVYIHLAVNGVHDEQGQLDHFIAIVLDISRRKQVEQALETNRMLLHSIINNTSDFIYVKDLQGRYQLFNAASEKAVGKRMAEVLGKDDYFLFPPHEAKTIMASDRQVLEGQSAITYEEVVTFANGKLMTLLATKGPVFGPDGEKTGLFGIVRDFTERKQMELDLQHAKDAAEVANRAKSGFLAKMSHELRTPLNGILGYTQILSRNDNLTVAQQEGLHIIERSGDYLLALINDILDLAKVEAGKVELSPTIVSLEELLRGIELLFQMRAEPKGIQFSYQPLSELPMAIEADETRLRQILINLLGNAFKFTERGAVTLTVAYIEGELSFQVSDQGCGIAAADLDKIFLPFQQVGDKKYFGQGTGLGLPITKKLVEMMGGELRVTSTLGQGSTFSVLLKLSQVPNLLHSTGDTKLPKIIGYQGRPRTVLVIDDNLVNRAVLVKLLTSLGFATLEAVDGQDGLKQAREIPAIDLILVDLVMPVLDGFAVIQQVKQIPQCRDTVLIVVSASAYETDRQKSLELGCQDFIAKPVKFEEFLERLRVHLNLTWLYDQTTAVASSPDARPGQLEVLPVALTAAQVTELLDLARTGDVRGVTDYTEALVQTDEALANFARYIHQLAEQYEFDKICKILEK